MAKGKFNVLGGEGAVCVSVPCIARDQDEENVRLVGNVGAGGSLESDRKLVKGRSQIRIQIK